MMQVKTPASALVGGGDGLVIFGTPAPEEKSYEEAHEAVLREQKMYHRGYQEKLYTKDAIKVGDAQMESEATRRHR